MNIAELLKDIPKGFKLYSPIFGEVTFLRVCGNIEVLDKNNVPRIFSSDGTYNIHGECMLFPSKDNRDWKSFKSFKKGEILILNDTFPFVYNGWEGQDLYGSICGVRTDNTLVTINSNGWARKKSTRKATEAEKEAFLLRLKREGYEWNSCNMTLIKITKFNILELKPFDKVLVRDNNYNDWKPALFYRYEENLIHPYVVSIYSSYAQCIPYNNDTKHLVGTNKDCPEYYKTW